jgi:hypothetical protein
VVSHSESLLHLDFFSSEIKFPSNSNENFCVKEAEQYKNQNQYDSFEILLSEQSYAEFESTCGEFTIIPQPEFLAACST